MYYLTYKDFDTGFIFNQAKPLKHSQLRSAATELFQQFGHYGTVQVLVTEGDSIVINRFEPEPY